MPFPCYSYAADVPSAGSSRNAAPRARPGVRQMPFACFRYQAEAPPSKPYSCYSYPMMCFSYPSGVRQMPGTSSCFRY
jgi:hypothetical protein